MTLLSRTFVTALALTVLSSFSPALADIEFPCAEDLRKSLSQKTIDGIRERTSRVSFTTSETGISLIAALSENCTRRERDMISDLGVTNAETQLSILAEAVFLAAKYDGNTASFISFWPRTTRRLKAARTTKQKSATVLAAESLNY